MDDRIIDILLYLFIGYHLRHMVGDSMRVAWVAIAVQVSVFLYVAYVYQVTLITGLGFVVLGVAGWFPYKLWLNWREARKAEA